MPPQEDCLPSSWVVCPPAGLFALQRPFSRGQTTLILGRLEEITVSLIFKFILSPYREKVWSSPFLEGKNPFLEMTPQNGRMGSVTVSAQRLQIYCTSMQGAWKLSARKWTGLVHPGCMRVSRMQMCSSNAGLVQSSCRRAAGMQVCS